MAVKLREGTLRLEALAELRWGWNDVSPVRLLQPRALRSNIWPVQLAIRPHRVNVRLQVGFLQGLKEGELFFGHLLLFRKRKRGLLHCR